MNVSFSQIIEVFTRKVPGFCEHFTGTETVILKTGEHLLILGVGGKAR